MGVFDLIRSVFGLGGSEDHDGTEVSVEYEPDEERTETDNDEGDESAETPAAAGTDAVASTDSMTEPSPDTEPETAAEPAEATGPVPDEPKAEAETETEAEPEPTEAEEDEPADDETEETAAEAESAESVETISGIGSAYGDRLAAADVETVEQLLEADPEELADRTDISAKRISRWQENATES